MREEKPKKIYEGSSREEEPSLRAYFNPVTKDFDGLIWEYVNSEGNFLIYKCPCSFSINPCPAKIYVDFTKNQIQGVYGLHESRHCLECINTRKALKTKKEINELMKEVFLKAEQVYSYLKIAVNDRTLTQKQCLAYLSNPFNKLSSSEPFIEEEESDILNQSESEYTSHDDLMRKELTLEKYEKMESRISNEEFAEKQFIQFIRELSDKKQLKQTRVNNSDDTRKEEPSEELFEPIESDKREFDQYQKKYNELKEKLQESKKVYILITQFEEGMRILLEKTEIFYKQLKKQINYPAKEKNILKNKTKQLVDNLRREFNETDPTSP